ncbi:hypothetical protein PybrP1_000736 [[Pythium] brassicae (nom. inval.)]|nr:hypothetical protein PybrP1_000736 [[Pythium] brassicae (nom. inval.)]
MKFPLPRNLFPPRREHIRVFCERRRKGGGSSSSRRHTAETVPEATTAANISGMPEDDPNAVAALPMFRTSARFDENLATRPTAGSFAMSELSDFESEDEFRDTTVLSSPGSKLSGGSPPSGRVKSNVEFNGSVSSKVALRTAANTLASVALAEVSSHSRKMGWEVTKCLRNPRRLAQAADAPPSATSSRCSNCNKRFHIFNSALVCFFCTTRVCSKCCERRTLTIPNPAARKSHRVTKLATRTAVKTCKGCYTTVFRSQRPEDVAREEILEGEYGSMAPRVPLDAHAWQRPSETALPEVEEEDLAAQHAGIYGWEHQARAVSISSTSTMSVEDLKELVDQLARQSAMSAEPEPLEEEVEWEENGREWSDSTVIELNRDDGEWVKSTPASPAFSYPKSERQSLAGSADEDLYTRISKLHQTAENLYQSVTSMSSSVGARRG